MKTLFASSLVLAAFASLANAQSIFLTGFETPNYVVGQSIDGVDNWFSAISPDAPFIARDPALAAGGRRALQCWGGSPDLESSGGLLDGAWAQPMVLDPGWSQNALVRVQCDVRLDGPDTGTGPNDDLVSANLIGRNGVGQSASMFLSSTGQVFCNSSGAAGSFFYQFATPVPLGQYSRLAIVYDYTTHLAAFEVNGVIIGVLPFGGGAAEGFRGVFLEFAAYDDPQLVDPSLYTGYWDNVFVLAVPGN
ncbi:MAG TPA: hypothetical protein VF384_05965 [Planctomycetota bacterium]